MGSHALTFDAGHQQKALDFQASLVGTTSIAQTESGEWRVEFPGQLQRGVPVYYAVLPDGRVVSRRSKRPMLGVVATLTSQSVKSRIRAGIRFDAMREYELAVKAAAVPESMRAGSTWEAASKLVTEFASEDEYAAHKVQAEDRPVIWEDFSWRQTAYSASEHAKKVSLEDRWESVKAIKAYGGE